MKKVLVFMLAVMMVVSMALPAAAVASPSAKPGELLPALTEKSYEDVILHSTEDVLKLDKSIQDLMAEAKAELPVATPKGFAVLYFFYVEIIGDMDVVTIDIESIEESVGTGSSLDKLFEAAENGEVHFMQYVDGEWEDREFKINADGTITIYGVVEGPKAVFIK